jgi:hypothetical protein
MSRDSDTRNVNSGSAAAALGLAVAVDDIENVGNDSNSYNDSNSHNSSDNDTVTKTDNDTVSVTKNDNDSYTKNDNDTYTKTVSLSDDDVKNSYNQDNDTNSNNYSDNDTFTKTITDNDSYTKTVSLSDDDTITKTVNLSDDDVKNSHNQDNDVVDSYNQDNDSFSKTVSVSDDDISDSYNATDIDTTVDVAISDAFKKIEDSYNSDDDWLELDNLDFDVLNVVGAGTLAGAGNDAMFNISQVSEMTDSDRLYNPKVENDSWFKQDAYADGGRADGADDLDDRGSVTASADGVASMEAFTQNIVMGANIQYNNIDMSVVGGDSTVTDGGDIS